MHSCHSAFSTDQVMFTFGIPNLLLLAVEKSLCRVLCPSGFTNGSPISIKPHELHFEFISICFLECTENQDEMLRSNCCSCIRNFLERLTTMCCKSRDIEAKFCKIKAFFGEELFHSDDSFKRLSNVFWHEYKEKENTIVSGFVFKGCHGDGDIIGPT